jgi:large repetitive protein
MITSPKPVTTIPEPGSNISITPTPSSISTPATTSTQLNGSLKVICNCISADIFLDEEAVGYTNSFGTRTIDDIPAGTYTVEITHNTYGNGTKHVRIEGGKTTLAYIYLANGEENATPCRDELITPESEALYGTLSIVSNAISANVYVGGESGGYTGSFGNKEVEGLLPGTYTVKITHPTYGDGTKHIKIEAGKTTLAYIYLANGEENAGPCRNETVTPESEALYGTLSIISDSISANVYVDGESGGYTNSFGSKKVEGLLPGTYTVKITHPTYGDGAKHIKIEAGKTTTAYIYLPIGEENTAPCRDEIITPESEALYGSLRIECNCSAANVFIGGESAGTTGTPGITTIEGLLPGTYTIKVTSQGRKTWTGTIAISTGQTAALTVRLEYTD